MPIIVPLLKALYTATRPNSAKNANDQRHGHVDGQDSNSPDTPASENEDAEKGNEEHEGPKPVNFFDPALKAIRRQVFLGWGKTTLILCTFILAVLSLYWGSQSHVYKNMASLTVFVVDFDGLVAPYDNGLPPLVGPTVVQGVRMVLQQPQPPAVMSLNSPQPHLGYIPTPPSQFNNDPMAVREAVYHQKAWAAIIVNPNATALLREAVAQGNASYDPRGAAQTVYVQARQETTYNNYIIPQLTSLETQITSTFGKMWAQMVLQNATDNPDVLANIQRASQAVNPAIGFTTINLRPFGPPVATPTITVGLIYLIIISFFSFSFYLPIHLKLLNTSPGQPRLKFPQLIIWRYISTVTAYLFLSLAYSFVSLAFQIPFRNAPAPPTEVANNANAYGSASFVVFWTLNFVGMIALGLACENVAMLVGQPWTAFWLIFWVISNVVASFYEIATEPKFYYWGYAWPLQHVVEGSRTIIFDIHSRLGLNFGVLLAWAAVNTAFYPVCCFVMRKKMQKGLA
ncbi:MAG: hypothetical protein M1817_005463 [Caeruleum heppii]|nr:MAG: hypothetical protein M1817_005463 [Caeruleum heppii]